MQEVLTQAETKMKKTLSILTSEYTTIRAGRANPTVLDKIMVNYYDTPAAANQLAAISVSEARLLTIQPWDTSSVRAVEKVIFSSELGINPQSDDKVTHLMFPQLTEGCHRDITKDITKMSEEAKVVVRSIRRDAIEKLKAKEKAAEITEDDLKQGGKKTQDLTDKYYKEIDMLFERKQREAMEIQNRLTNHVSDREQPIIPRHLGIIMDGNGRWAKKRGLPCSAGCTTGATSFKKITRYCASIGVKYLTMYAFSTENWKRPSDEIEALMKIFQQYLEETLRDFLGESIRVKFLGSLSVFPQHLQNLFARTEEVSADRTRMVLNIAMNYDGHTELTHTVRLLTEQVQGGTLLPEQITENLISQHLYMTGQSDSDLMLRPNGEYRISNFLL